jgi:hypothetical protein
MSHPKVQSFEKMKEIYLVIFWIRTNTMEGVSTHITQRESALIAIKLVHTLLWAILAGATLVLPVMAVLGRFDWVLALTILMLMECGILLLNGWRCPLTNLAAHFTNERSDNFDIYLPRWLAHWNKTIFGSLFLVGELIALWCRFR